MGYVYQEYPRLLYGAGGGVRLVASDAERDVALAAGWHLTPGPWPEPAPVKRKPGRPPKLQNG